MTDRELLELAARAAGYRVVSSREFGGLNVDIGGGNTIVNWNPLADSGAALQLAVALGIDVVQHNDASEGRLEVLAWTKKAQMFDEPYGSNPQAATRRAIVRAAAAIGARGTTGERT